MSKGKIIGKAISEMAAELAAKTKKPEVSRIDMGYKDVTKRIPELTEAARLVKSGQMSPKQYSDIVNRVKPVTPYDFVPKPASADEAVAALTSNKKGQFGKSSEIKEGERADLRLDIPSYSQHGVWVNSIHRKDAPTVYSSVSSVKNAEMIPSADKALKVATGETPKSPFAVIRGEWNPMDEESAVKAAQKYLQDKNWRQVGYDPERHGYFYDRETMAPILGAEEVIQIGPLVLAKKPKYGSQEDFPFKDGGPVHKSAGGRMAKSIGAMAAELSKKRAVLPKEEAEANLRKMLESSKATETQVIKPTEKSISPGANREKILQKAKQVENICDYMNCHLFAQQLSGISKINELPLVKKAQPGDIYRWEDGLHYAIDIGDGQVIDVPEWGGKPEIKSLSDVIKEYDVTDQIYRPPVESYEPKYEKKQGGPVHKQDGGSIKASPAKPGQQFLGRLGQVAEKLGIKLEEAMKIVAQEGNSPVKAFLVNMLGSETLKSAGTALQDWTGTPRDATEDYPYRRLMTGKGMTAQFDPRLVDVAPIAGTAASRVAHGIKHLPTDVMRAAMAAYGPQATASPLDVWHGSPHRFKPTEKNPLGQFDPTKIGTGEGNQAYGYGHYLAERPGVAKTYGRMESEYKRMTQGFEPKVEYAYDLMTKGLDDAKVLDNFAYKYGSDLSFDDAMKAIKEAREHINAGNLYKVDLPDEQIAKMLDWDKPLSEQPEIQKVLKGTDYEVGISNKEAEKIADMRLRQEADEWAEETGGDPVDYINNANWDKYVDDARKESGNIDSATTGAELHRMIMRDEGYRPELSDPENYQVPTSEYLRSMGIPGIKYLDQASRDAGEGTRNFVVFPGGEEMLTIKERMKDGGPAHKAAGGIARRLAKYGKHHEPAKKTEIFIGEKSPLWNQDAAGAAVKMEKAGVNPVDIWKQTGTFRSPDGALRQEISDVGSKFRGEKEMKELAASMKQEEEKIKAAIAESKLHPDLFPKQLKEAQRAVRQGAKDIKQMRTMQGGPQYGVHIGNKAGFALHHPELYEAYPKLLDMDVKQGGRYGSARASYIPGANENDPGSVNIYDLGLKGNPRSSAIHEVQHAIQNIEGWGQGGDPTTAFQNQEAFDILNQMRKQALEPMTYEEFLDKHKGSGIESMSPGDAIKHYELYKERIPEKVKQMDAELQRQAAKLYYDRLAGEAEARAAQARIDLTPQQRLENFPLETGTQYGYDVEPEDIIVKRRKKGGQVSIDAMRLAVGGGITGIFKESAKAAAKAAKSAEKAREFTSMDRARAGFNAAELIKTQPQVLPSEALGQAMEKGFKKLSTTQSDRARVGGGNIGGAPFPVLGEVDPAYAGKSWGVMDAGTASRLINLSSPETAWTTLLGSATQLKTNPIVFDKMKRAFLKSMKEGNLSKELERKINKNLEVTFGEGASIRDPKIWKEADSFEKRAALADVMMGQGLPPSKGGVAIGGEKSGKGVIFKPTEILVRETEPYLLHPEHGGDVPTFALGPRLFTIGKEQEYRPELHPAFPTLLSGKDLGFNIKPSPSEILLPQYYSRFKELFPERKSPGYYDLALGLKGEGLPSQDLNDPYIRHLIREGFKKGGAVKKAEGGQITADDLIVEERPL